MTSNTTINTALISLGAFFAGLVPVIWGSNPYLSIASAILAVVIFSVYELLP